MAAKTGTILLFKSDRGFGFIKPHGGGPDLFFHIKDASGFAGDPRPGDAVMYEEGTGRDGRPAAFNVKPLEAQATQSYRFLNPYNFVRFLLPPKSVKDGASLDLLGQCPPAPHDRWVGLSGKIVCQIMAESTIFVSDSESISETKVGDQKVHKSYRFFHCDFNGKTKQAIPASSLRGMIRNVFEAITNSCFAHFPGSMRLSYHLPAVQAPYLVPARAIQTGKDEWQLELLTGSTPLAIQQRPQGPQYAAWVRKWERPLIGQPPDFKYPRNGYGKRPVIALNNYHHKDSVFARLHKYTHPAARFEFWNVEEIYENEDTIPQNGHAGLIAKGYLCLTNQNIERKHDERFFFRLLHNTTGPFAIELPPHVREAYEDLIKDYQFRHDDEVRKRGDKAGQPIFEEGKPKPAFSRFVIDPYEKRLRDGDLVYVWLEGAIEKPIVKFIVPVSVPRVACDHRIGELLPNHRALHKCQSSDDKLCLCPACRVFGWVEGQSESGQRSKIAYAGRLRFEHAQLINKPKPESHTLAILSSPKPTTTRFYLVNADGYPSRTLGPSGEEGLPLSEKDAGYDGPGRQIRGRKFYRHHANGKIMTTSERTDQNRTIADALPKSAIFQFEVKFENMSPIELGALLWALEMPDPDDNTKKLYHRLGYGKPLGLGSVQITVHSVECLNFKKRYQSLAESGPINIPPEEWKKWRTAFEKAMADRYDEKEFRQLKNIRDLKALLSAPPDDLPIHYPRPTLKPDEDHPSYEWFMGNNRDKGPKFELPLAEDDTVGLPLVDKQGRWY